jgi:oligopeptidase B
VEFGAGKDHLFFTETEGINRRPFKVTRLDLKTGEKSTIFVDDDPTHYIDISVSKDRKFLIINSSTKEDSEIWVLPRAPIEGWPDSSLPKKVVARNHNMSASLWHVRDFFILITKELSGEAKSQRILALTDAEIVEGNGTTPKLSQWRDYLDLYESTDDLVITEFDSFENFIAIYCKRNGKPEILIQDLDTKTFDSVNIDQDVGEIHPGINQDYNAQELTFTYESPFVYE